MIVSLKNQEQRPKLGHSFDILNTYEASRILSHKESGVPLKFSVSFYDFLGNHDSIANPYLI